MASGRNSVREIKEGNRTGQKDVKDHSSAWKGRGGVRRMILGEGLKYRSAGLLSEGLKAERIAKIEPLRGGKGQQTESGREKERG